MGSRWHRTAGGIGRRRLHIGVSASDLLTQSEHQRGVPYLVTSSECLFIVITDDPAWASAAIAQLPK
jgi:hypothetical protein